MRLINSFLLFFVFFSTCVLGQENADSKIESEMIGSWVITVDGDVGVRAMIVKKIAQKSNNTHSIDGLFGYLGKEQQISYAEINRVNNEYNMTLTAKSGARVVATKTQDGLFVGKFIYTNNKESSIKIAKVSDAEYIEHIRTKELQESTLKASLMIKKPSVNVPKSCAVFSGHWSGSWRGGGQMWLWVANVSENCKVEFAYLPHSNQPKQLGSNEAWVRDGILSFVCNSNGGTCFFELHGDDLWSRYSGPDGNNNGVFRKIQ